MSKLSKDKRDKIILIGMGTAVACAAVWFLVIQTQRTALTRVRKEADKAREQLASGERTLKSQATVQQEFAETSEALRRREADMASPNDMYLWHIQTLNNFRTGHKVEIPQFGREVPTEVTCLPKFPYRAASFTVRGAATYHDFGKFLAEFENAFPYIRVQNVDLEPSTGETARGADNVEKLNFRMELVTLVRPTAL